MNAATIAVVIPTRNMADTLWVALGSAMPADEIIVVDDASEDDTSAVVARWKEKHANLSYIKHAEKLPDHNLAQKPVYAAIQSDYVIGLGADDRLYPECFREIKNNQGQAVVFTAVDVLIDGIWHARTDASNLRGTVSAAAVRENLKSQNNATESGIGSALRTDVANYLWSIGWGELGPFMDSVGYATAACLHGAAYVPKRCASLALRERSYGRDPDRTAEYYLTMGQKCIDFMLAAGLPHDVISAIAKKRCGVEVTW